jgi:hypothetical protein
MIGKLIVLALVSCQFFVNPVHSQCSSPPTCAADQRLDPQRCKCLPSNINCADMTQDPLDCLWTPCSASNEARCRYKCLCRNLPSILNNYCPTCLNGGVLTNINSCSCDCAPGYKGPRCQYPADYSRVVDNAYCSFVDCNTASDEDFFKCPLKCIRCQNRLCNNMGSVVLSSGTCACKCIDNNIYDEANSCAVKAGGCINNRRCNFLLSMPNACSQPTIKFVCPQTCGVC